MSHSGAAGSFGPIAIVGRGCVLPGALTPAALWTAVAEGRDLLTPAPPGAWRISPDRTVPPGAGPILDRGGYVRGFEDVFDRAGFQFPADEIAALEPSAAWLLHAGREALREAGHSSQRAGDRAGAIVGNLSLPSIGLSRFAESVWLEPHGGIPATPGVRAVAADPRHRFMSGLPVRTLARALGLTGQAFALDAACASALYALRLACDALNRRDADLMLAGALNGTDPLFLHSGFRVLQALSPTGQSRPFHRDADGLVPSLGAVVFALRRLGDAVAARDRIFGVIRAVGLSNDGGGAGLLVPWPAGQERAIRAAHAASGLEPRDISLIEAHATGTPVGDAAEIRSTGAVYAGLGDVPLGSLKSNLGHSLTVSGAAGLLKVLGAMEAGVRPATLHAGATLPELAGSPFRLLTEAEPWTCTGVRRAAISSFGFGGNNAHLLVEQWDPSARRTAHPSAAIPADGAEAAEAAEAAELAIVGLGVIAAGAGNRRDFAEAVLTRAVRLTDGEGRADAAALDLHGLRFPPNDLLEALPQQVLLLHAAREALAETKLTDPARTGVFVGMQCDAEIARHTARLRMAEWAPEWANRAACLLPDGWPAAAQDAFATPLTPQAVLGTLPNIVANRLSAQFRLGGPGFSISAEELSGIAALETAAQALRAGELDAAVVGAVDLCCEPVHRAAARALLPETHHVPGDAAVVLVLKRLDDARRDGDHVLAALPAQGAAPAPAALEAGAALDPAPLFGHAHAAAGLLHLAAGVVCCAARALPSSAGPVPWLTDGEPRALAVRTDALGGGSATVLLHAGDAPASGPLPLTPALEVYTGADRAALAAAIRAGRPGASRSGTAHVAIAALSPHELAELRQGAVAFLEGRTARAPDGVFFRAAPVTGELAFVFTGAGAAYPGMGRDLAAAVPALLDGVAARLPSLQAAAGWVYADGQDEPTPLQKLAGSSFLAQLHAGVSLDVLGLRPAAAVGLSSGETNALAALGAWENLDGLMAGLAGIYARDIGGEFRALGKLWGGRGHGWEAWRLLAPVERVRAALAREPRVYLTMLHAPEDCAIGGEPAACRRVVERIGAGRAYPLGYDLAVHSPAVAEVGEAWRALHHRPTRPVPGVRFYSTAMGGAYEPTADAVADALTAMATGPVDFVTLVERAWAEGVRVFVEHGPRDLCSRWIGQILGDREHVAVSLDRPGVPGRRQLLYAAAALAAAGVDINVASVIRTLGTHGDGMDAAAVEKPAARARTLPVPAHPAPVVLPALPQPRITRMQPAPPLPSALEGGRPPLVPAHGEHVNGSNGIAAVPRNVAPAMSADPPVVTPVAQDARGAVLSGAHRAFLQRQAQVHAHFVRLQGEALGRVHAEAVHAEGLHAEGLHVEVGRAAESSRGASRAELRPLFDRAELERLASGRISDLFGPLFEAQDGYRRQVRMPMPPLLLADRVIRIDAEQATMGTGSIVTETDVTADAWYLHEGRMPVGIQVEAGQADLLLCSWVGADLLNQGERVYRLLGCELTFHGSRPRVGETIRYDIHLDRHVSTGNVRLFFFHYDSTVDGAPRLSVRGGHAGFFTEEELRASGGVIWDPAAERPILPASPAAIRPPGTRRKLTAEQVRAFAAGRPFDCFGAGFERAAAHTRSPRIQGGDMLLVDEVTEIDPAGGPWGLGYLRAVRQVSPDDWFFPGHFKNDPTMPGTLMYEGGLQAMSLYMAALGFTIERDGARFEPVPDVPYAMVCRGQVVPTSREIVYEVFVHGVADGAEPVLWADILLTVDGLKAFHCRRMGLRLVPDWPLETAPAALPARLGQPDGGPVATVDGFSFGHDSLLNCAWGRPSLAFGPRYLPFDSHRRLPRLPGPPYHFISRVTAVTGPMTVGAGGTVEVEYDVPPDAWYFQDSPGGAMPFAVLMEAALQPCGWLTAYLGVPLSGETDLFFRNLNGDGTVLGEVRADAGTLRTTVRCTDVSRSGETFIESFDVNCYLGEQHVFALKTTFGHFPAEALARQVGVPFTDAERSALEDAPSDVRIDLKGGGTLAGSGDAVGGAAGAEMTNSTLGIGRGRLALLDRVTGDWPSGGRAGRGRLRAEMDVDPGAWFFAAHFFQDPVQPGSLGVEAMLQLLQHYMLNRDMGQGMTRPRFQALEVGQAVTWKYRGQVVPTNRRVLVELEIHDEGRDSGGAWVRGEAWLWVDGRRIYHAPKLGMRITDDAPGAGSPPVQRAIPDQAPVANSASPGVPASPAAHMPVAAESVLDPAVDRWLYDHCPTYTVPALPMSFMIERMAAAARALRPELEVVGLADVQVKGWLVCDRARRLRTEVLPVARREDEYAVTLLAWRDASVAALSRFEPVASARVRLGATYDAPPAPLPPLTYAAAVADPYASGALIHGPAFHILQELRIGDAGSSARLDAGGGGTPGGVLNPLLLDGITHAIPNAELQQWAPAIGGDSIAYPAGITAATFHAPTPTTGAVTCEVRFAGFDAARRMAELDVQLLAERRVWADLRLVTALNPKGAIGALPELERRAFIRDRRPVPGAGLARSVDGRTVLDSADVAASDWLPGTLNQLYRTSERGGALARDIAIREHVARHAGVHPGTVTSSGRDGNVVAHCDALPFTRFTLAVREAGGRIVVGDAAPERTDFAQARAYWQENLGAARWPVEDMYFALAEKFVRRVVLDAPDAFAAIRGRSALFVGNHQVAIESFLFALLNPGLTGVSSVVLAKSEVRTRWLDEFLTLAEAYPGVTLPSFIIYLNQKNPVQVLQTFARCREQMARDGLSALVHVEGTRALSGREPVRVISSSLIDMAIGAGAPIVPVRFAGGLPATPLESRLHVPVGYGSQDYHYGAPILPAELEAVPYAERRQLVLDRINATGPDVATAEANPADPDFGDAVRSWMDTTGTDEEYSILLQALLRMRDPGVGVRQLLEAVAVGTLETDAAPLGAWTADLAGRLFGPRGPHVERAARRKSRR